MNDDVHGASRVVSGLVGGAIADLRRLPDGEAAVDEVTVRRDGDVDSDVVERVVVKDRLRPLDVGDEAALQVVGRVDEEDRRRLAKVDHRRLDVC